MKMDTQITQLRGITLKLSPPIERYHQRHCLEAWHINSAHAPLNRNVGFRNRNVETLGREL